MTPDLPAFRVGSTTRALRELADALEAHAIPESRAATRTEVRRITQAALDLTRLIAGSGKACLACGKPITRRRYADGHLESPVNFQRRQHCDRTCAGVEARTAVVTPRVCKHCGKALVQRDGERWDRFTRRVFCDRACFGASQRGTARKATRSKRQAQRPPTRPAAWERFERPRPAAPATTPKPLPDPRPKPTEAGVRMVTLGEPCPKHPGEHIGFYGCPACRAAEAWRAGERAVTIRPSVEGGR